MAHILSSQVGKQAEKEKEKKNTKGMKGRQQSYFRNSADDFCSTMLPIAISAKPETALEMRMKTNIFEDFGASPKHED